MGLSTIHLNQGQFNNSNINQFNFNVKRHYYILGGAHLKVSQIFEVETSVFSKTDGTSTQIDLKAIATYNGKFFGGLSYRIQDAIIPIIGAKWGTKDSHFTMSYSYDITTSALRGYSSGSHELHIGFCKVIRRYDNTRSVNPLWLGNYDFGPKK